MRATILSAADAAWGIGLGGRLPWNLPADLARFRKRTMGLTVIVGRRTALSLPGGLPGRRLVTVSSSGAGDCLSVAEALLQARGRGETEAVVAGGAAVYREAMAHADTAEITRVRGTWHCDVFMPDLAANGRWRLAERKAEDGLEIEFWEKKR